MTLNFNFQIANYSKIFPQFYEIDFLKWRFLYSGKKVYSHLDSINSFIKSSTKVTSFFISFLVSGFTFI